MDIQIRPATRETRNAFSSLLDEANAWQKARGSEGWSSPFDDDWMLPRIERGELFLVYLDSEPVSAFRILWEDRPFWGEREVGDSIYLHTFAVRRSKAGLGIGEAVIEKVVGMARERGLAKVRLDCFLSSANLIAFYERNGFVSVGTTSMKGKMMNLMERAI
ncbi:GNAT family N-acetyltransferase [Mesorhizobium sp. CGMCC 1.15528]|uniref:GNAT family N-acetyltransferase n=1 Tax=Mesorhizobium zhangyense TaxID=1776730 RepID=A0A7C9R917_9HYPH|nr:GNAT family N-acetyltransferase [Mesorhizobium zhangyense]NGN43154.1 GNAT family N-acetyltransferase [Mesorhizobium zhangyense]